MEIIFEGDRIYTLKEAEVRTIMEEDTGTRNERKELKDQRDVLRNGLDICKEIAARPDLGPYEYQDTSFLDEPVPSIPQRPMSSVTRRDVGTGLNPYPDFNAGPSLSARSSVQGSITPNRNSGGWGDPPARSSLDIPGAPNLQTPTSTEEEDEDLKRALAESKKEAEIRKIAHAPVPAPSMPPRPAPTIDDDGRSTQSGRRRILGLGRY